MDVGFTIVGSSISENDRKSVASFLSSTFILPNEKIADNIVTAVINGCDINMFDEDIDYSLLDEQPFEYRKISVQDGNYLLVSAVDFKIELQSGADILTLRPTEFITIAGSQVNGFATEEKQGLVRIFPAHGGSVVNWILITGNWNDNAEWNDSQFWIDSL